MSDDPSTNDPGPRSWIDKIAEVFWEDTPDLADILQLLDRAVQKKVLSADAFAIIQGALQVSTKKVGDFMIPRGKVVTVRTNQKPQEILRLVADASHSRFPVIGDDNDVDNVVGVLLAKDLLPLLLKSGRSANFDVRKITRPTPFVSEQETLNEMLNTFREKRRHMAIVLDKYGSMCGIITIEDVLEQIVGDIKDETDPDPEKEEQDYITTLAAGVHQVDAMTPIAVFNQRFNTEFGNGESATISGVILEQFDHIPKAGESVAMGSLRATVLQADSRQIHQLKITETSVGEQPRAN